jgi:2,3-bisphosphoglycerate-independent phosphoglycerate mutase
MSASEIYDEYEKNVIDFDFCVVNIANGDMVGHTAVMKAGIEAMQEVDKIVGEIIDFCKTRNIDLLISADHGNCEEIGSPENPKTSHTTNDVPFWYIRNGEIIKTKPYG